MKKLLFLALLTPLWFGCSEKTDPQPNNKVTETPFDGKKCDPTRILNGNDINDFTFNSDGTLQKESLYEGAVFINAYSYEYLNGKLSKIRRNSEAGGVLAEFDVTHDAVGRLFKASNAAKEYQLTYDNDGRILEHVEATNGSVTHRTKYQYTGEQISVNGTVHEFDKNYNPFAASIKALIIEGYWFKNNPVKISWANSTDVDNFIYAYNSSGYPETGTHTFPSGTVQQQTYSYSCK